VSNVSKVDEKILKLNPKIRTKLKQKVGSENKEKTETF